MRRPVFSFDWLPMRGAATTKNTRAKREATPLPTVVFLHGAPASGKLTIAKELCALTDLSLFHNHLVVDLLLSLFPFGSPEFVKHREAIWLELMEETVSRGRSLVFTFTPERSVKTGFPRRLAARIKRVGGVVRFVRVSCDEKAIEERMSARSRRRHGKLVSLQFYRELRGNGAFDYSPIDSEFEIDSTSALPRDSAIKIMKALSLTESTSQDASQS